MSQRAALEQETAQLQREISSLETQIKGVRDYVAAQERNLRSAAESVRAITERSLAEARGDLYLKDLRLQQVRQDLQARQAHLAKLGEIDRKRQEVATLEREQQRIAGLLDRARVELLQLEQTYQASQSTAATPAATLVFTAGAQFVLADQGRDLVIGWTDGTLTPDIDLSALGGATSGVSRRHAVLRASNGAWTITDTGSTNGTFIDQRRITPNVPTPLSDQAKLRFGNLEAVFGVQASSPIKTTRL